MWLKCDDCEHIGIKRMERSLSPDLVRLCESKNIKLIADNEYVVSQRGGWVNTAYTVRWCGLVDDYPIPIGIGHNCPYLGTQLKIKPKQEETPWWE